MASSDLTFSLYSRAFLWKLNILNSSVSLTLCTREQLFGNNTFTMREDNNKFALLTQKVVSSFSSTDYNWSNTQIRKQLISQNNTTWTKNEDPNPQTNNYSVKNETEAYPKLRSKFASQHKANLPQICDRVMCDTIYYLIIVIYYFWYFYVKNVILGLCYLFPCF